MGVDMGQPPSGRASGRGWVASVGHGDTESQLGSGDPYSSIHLHVTRHPVLFHCGTKIFSLGVLTLNLNVISTSI